MKFFGYLFCWLLSTLTWFTYGLPSYPIDTVWADEAMERHFSNENVVVVWRGVHFLEDHFESNKDRLTYWQRQDVQMPIYCAAAHEKTRIPFGSKINARQHVLFGNAAKDIQSQIDAMRKSLNFRLNDTIFDNRRFAFQHLYSNDYDRFHNILSDQCPQKYQALSHGLRFSHNPFVSCTTSISHAARYAFGMKYYGDTATPLKPDYKYSGNPENPWLGILYGMILDEKVADEILPFNVPAHHHAGHISVNTHYTCNILTEEEVSVVGRIPGKAVVIKHPMTVPSFYNEYDASIHHEKYALSAQRYDNAKSKLKKRNKKNGDVRQKVTEDIMGQIITPKNKDKAGNHKKTLEYTLTQQMKRKLRNLGATLGEIGTDGKIA